MAGVGKILKFAVSPLAAALGAFDKPKAPKAVMPLPTATPRSSSVVADALMARRGSAANRRTGSGGAESGTGKKTYLGQ